MYVRINALFFSIFVTLLPSQALADRLAEAQRLKGEGKWHEALQQLREEVASPRFTLQATTHAVNVRQNLLVMLGEYAALHGADEKTDAEARAVYEEGRKIASSRANQAILDNGMAVYWSKTHRNGLALPHMRRDLQHWLDTSDSQRIMLGYHALAVAITDMGQLDLAAHYRAKALETARSYYVVGSRPTAIQEWLNYWTVLGEFMSHAATRGDMDELEALWKLREPIAARYINPIAITLADAAEHFGIAGDAKRALEFIVRAHASWAVDRARFPQNVQTLVDITVICKSANVSRLGGHYKQAVEQFAKCDDLNKAAGMKDADISQVLRGAAYEGAGDLASAARAYQVAIDAAERTRGSFTVAERGNFFRTVLRRPYWGQIRVLARSAAADGGDAAFFRALQVSELVRARQLGELLDPEASRRVSAEGLAAMQRRLKPDEVILAYTVTDTEIILLVMASTATRAIPIKYEPAAFRAQATAIAADLGKPHSAMDTLNARLAELGRLLIAPAAGDLQGKRRITVLPDGLMNLVPFELLSYAAQGYRPLYRDYIVVNSPSLLFVEHAERARPRESSSSLFAMADPVYPKNPTLKVLEEDELRAVTKRNSRYLSYFTALPETRTEVQAIGGLFGGEKVQLLLGEQALESAIKKADLSAFRFLHFATHGVIGNEVPGLQEPALVLGAEPGEDGFLTMSEVSRLKVNAEITVLSACNTGSGEFVEGEGVMGMSRAFLAAGSRSVIVSLWPVASKATERLMVSFYGHLRRGNDPAGALRAAKLEFIELAAKAGTAEVHPFFWAPFILLGG